MDGTRYYLFVHFVVKVIVSILLSEQLEKPHYSLASDVYSFGVLMYELYARDRPWNDLSNIKAAQLVLTGERLEAPASQTPPPVRKLMQECFRERPSERPTMAEIIVVLSSPALAVENEN